MTKHTLTPEQLVNAKKRYEAKQRRLSLPKTQQCSLCDKEVNKLGGHVHSLDCLAGQQLKLAKSLGYEQFAFEYNKFTAPFSRRFAVKYTQGKIKKYSDSPNYNFKPEKSKIENQLMFETWFGKLYQSFLTHLSDDEGKGYHKQRTTVKPEVLDAFTKLASAKRNGATKKLASIRCYLELLMENEHEIS